MTRQIGPMSPPSSNRLVAAGSLIDRPVAGYALAIVSTLVALGVRTGLDDGFPPGFPFVTFFPAIIITSFIAGTGPGIAAALLGMVVAEYFVMEPRGAFALNSNAVPIAFYLAVAAVDIGLIHVMQRALDRLRAERRLTASLYEEQRTLFEELQHRVANNMAFISGLLRLQKRRIVADPANAAGVFDEAVARIDIMGRIHRRLYDPAAANQALPAHLQSVCDELLQVTGTRGVTCRVDLPDTMRVPIDRLLPLSLLVAEVVTNSLKHGLAGRDTGLISITLEGSAAQPVLVIRDNGVGLPADHGTGGPGLGLRIIEGLVAQVGGTLTMASENGAVTRVQLPA